MQSSHANNQHLIMNQIISSKDKSLSTQPRFQHAVGPSADTHQLPGARIRFAKWILKSCKVRIQTFIKTRARVMKCTAPDPKQTISSVRHGTRTCRAASGICSLVFTNKVAAGWILNCMENFTAEIQLNGKTSGWCFTSQQDNKLKHTHIEFWLTDPVTWPEPDDLL